MDYATLTANGTDFAYLEAGSARDPLALLLHGFPDSAHTWRHLMEPLAARGFHVVAPFTRGYAPSAVPHDGRYQVAQLALDANAIHDALGADSSAVIIGHDWGAMTVYGAINIEPDRWRRAVAASVPPFGAAAEGFFRFDQLKRSWYMFFFQNPLAEMAVGMDNLAFIDGLWADWSPGYDASEDLAYVKASLKGDDHLLAALSYYRAMFDPQYQHDELASHTAALSERTLRPTLYLHGANDGCMALGNMGDPLPHLAESSAMVVVDDAGHFLHLEQPEVVGTLITDWVAP